MSARLALVGTGGTISCTLDADGRAVKTLRAADLLARAPVPPGAEVSATDFGLVSSWDLTPAAMLDVARTVEQLAAGCHGVVVTHGTDTLEETAALLSFAVASPVPVVVTGAMRPSDSPGADGPANLGAALAVILWLWLSSIVVLAGGVINAELQHLREEQIGEEQAREKDA